MLRDQVDREKLWGKIEAIPFFAFDRSREGLIPVYSGDGQTSLATKTCDA